MSWQYNPVAAAQANGTWDTTFLSDRDVSAQVPINFVPHPGVYVTAACFGNNVFEDNSLMTCLSNLLSSQFRRYVIDVYWDPSRRVFSLCPVQMYDLTSGTPSNTSSSTSLTATGLNSFASSTLESFDHTILNSLGPRQTSPLISADDEGQLLQVGPYQCSATLTLSSVASVFQDFLTVTSTDIEAKIVLWNINLHVALPPNVGTANRSLLTESEWPNSTETITSHLSSISNAIYTPSQLSTDRVDLNASWYRRTMENELPLLSYMTTQTLPDGSLRSDNGWPNENFIQFAKQKRMLVGFGTIDDTIASYDTNQDVGLIFPPGYINSNHNVTFGNDGQITGGCSYNAQEFDVEQVNNSWAVYTINSNGPENLGLAADNLTTCGIGQLLNVTVGDETANNNPVEYQTFGNQAIFSWAYGEPKNDSSAGIEKSEKFRCALVVANSAYRGHWRVEYCNSRYRAACRESKSPYRWQVSSYDVPYDAGDAACTGNMSFGVPRTGLELTYLYNHILNESKENSRLLDGVWINFNSLDYEGCWVTTGPNGTCPYGDDASATQSRQILIPALAALIVLILTGLTILAKCSANVRNSRMRKRGEGGWDYEGIPS